MNDIFTIVAEYSMGREVAQIRSLNKDLRLRVSYQKVYEENILLITARHVAKMILHSIAFPRLVEPLSASNCELYELEFDWQKYIEKTNISYDVLNYFSQQEIEKFKSAAFNAFLSKFSIFRHDHEYSLCEVSDIFKFMTFIKTEHPLFNYLVGINSCAEQIKKNYLENGYCLPAIALLKQKGVEFTGYETLCYESLKKLIQLLKIQGRSKLTTKNQMIEALK